VFIFSFSGSEEAISLHKKVMFDELPRFRKIVCSFYFIETETAYPPMWRG